MVEERRQLEEEKQKFAIERAEKAGFLIYPAIRKVYHYLYQVLPGVQSN